MSTRVFEGSFLIFIYYRLRYLPKVFKLFVKCTAICTLGKMRLDIFHRFMYQMYTTHTHTRAHTYTVAINISLVVVHPGNMYAAVPNNASQRYVRHTHTKLPWATANTLIEYYGGTSMWSIHLGFWFNFVLHIRMWPSGDDIQEVPFHPLAEFATHRLFCVFRRNSLFNIIHWQFLNWISHCAIPTFSAVEQKIKRRIDNAQANTFAAKFNSHTKMQCEKLVHPRTLCVYV